LFIQKLRITQEVATKNEPICPYQTGVMEFVTKNDRPS